MINCYLKNIKICNIAYPNDPIKPQNLPVPLQPVEEPLRQTWYYKSSLETYYKLLEEKKHKVQWEHWE